MSKRLVVGLGNVGTAYTSTRHNIGFDVLDVLVSLMPEASQKTLNKKLKSEIIQFSTFVCAYPQTFMNNSGQAVSAMCSWYKLSPRDVVVVHDDVHLPLGRMKWTYGSGAGGQHGVESIINHLHTKEFFRLKFGVGPDPGGDKRSKFVLSKFSKKESPIKDIMLQYAAESLYKYLVGGEDTTSIMAYYNGLDYQE